MFLCKYCYHDADDEAEGPSIACDYCLSWVHLKCVGLKNAPKTRTGTVDNATIPINTVNQRRKKDEKEML